MENRTDPTLEELESAGKLSNAVVLLYGRVLGGGWRRYRRSEAERLLAAANQTRRTTS